MAARKRSGSLFFKCRTQTNVLSCSTGVRRRRRRRRRAGHNISKDDDHSITNFQNIATLGSNIDCMDS
jgi:hypothetical protein